MWELAAKVRVKLAWIVQVVEQEPVQAILVLSFGCKSAAEIQLKSCDCMFCCEKIFILVLGAHPFI